MDRRAAVLLLTESPDFESLWTAACRDYDLPTSRVGFSDLAGSEPPAMVVVDGASVVQPRGLLLSCLARARASGAITALALSGYESDRGLDDLYVELCNGLIARSEDDVQRVVTALRRRSAPDRDARFEHLCTAASDHELLAVLGDGSVVMVDRPTTGDDAQLSVESIRVHEDRARATVQLKDGSEIELRAVELAQARTTNTVSTSPAALGDVDGVRLGQRLRALRLAAGLTQAELARRTGIHRPNIARVEAGRHTPSLETLARLAAAIGVSTTRVLSD
ncbi:MAG TPA: helix-turn-helix transcriptional regulator [Polyangiales bacterium]